MFFIDKALFVLVLVPQLSPLGNSTKGNIIVKYIFKKFPEIRQKVSTKFPKFPKFPNFYSLD